MSPAGTDRRSRSGSGRGGRAALGLVAVTVMASVTAIASVVVVGSAAAHTDLIQGSPGPGQRIGGVVDFVDLVFAAPVTEVEMAVIGPDGSVQPGAMVVAEGQVIRHEMEALTEPGRYLVEYQMISDDGDATVDTYFFDYDEAAVAPTPLGHRDVPDDPLLTSRDAVGAAAAIVLLAACLVLVLRLRRSRAELAARRDHPVS